MRLRAYIKFEEKSDLTNVCSQFMRFYSWCQQTDNGTKKMIKMLLNIIGWIHENVITSKLTKSDLTNV